MLDPLEPRRRRAQLRVAKAVRREEVRTDEREEQREPDEDGRGGGPPEPRQLARRAPSRSRARSRGRRTGRRARASCRRSRRSSRRVSGDAAAATRGRRRRTGAARPRRARSRACRAASPCRAVPRPTRARSARPCARRRASATSSASVVSTQRTSEKRPKIAVCAQLRRGEVAVLVEVREPKRRHDARAPQQPGRRDPDGGEQRERHRPRCSPARSRRLVVDRRSLLARSRAFERARVRVGLGDQERVRVELRAVPQRVRGEVPQSPRRRAGRERDRTT